MRLMSFLYTLLLLLALCVERAQADESNGDALVTTASLNLTEPAPPSAFMQQLSHGVFDAECWSATNEVVVELDDGAVVLRHIDRFFHEVNIVFGYDQRTLRPAVLPADARWYFCFEVLAAPDELGNYEPVVKTYRVVPPDTSS